jgi:hypothetical protein
VGVLLFVVLVGLVLVGRRVGNGLYDRRGQNKSGGKSGNGSGGLMAVAVAVGGRERREGRRGCGVEEEWDWEG